MPSGSCSRPGCAGSSTSRAAAFFQATISGMPLGLDEPERRGELAHAEVQAVHRVVGLAVVAERARELEQVRVRGRRACRPRRWRSSWWRRTTRRPRRPTCPGRRPFQSAPCAWAQSSIRKMPSRAAQRGDRARRRTRCGRRCGRGSPPSAGAVGHPPRSRANDMQRSSRLQSTNSTRAPACSAASGVAMNVFDGHSTVSPRTPANSSAASARARPARERHRAEPVPGAPGGLEARGQRALGPALRVDDAVPQRVHARAVALVEADRELLEARLATSARRRPRRPRRPRGIRGGDRQQRREQQQHLVRVPERGRAHAGHGSTATASSSRRPAAQHARRPAPAPSASENAAASAGSRRTAASAARPNVSASSSPATGEPASAEISTAMSRSSPSAEDAAAAGGRPRRGAGRAPLAERCHVDVAAHALGERRRRRASRAPARARSPLTGAPREVAERPGDVLDRRRRRPRRGRLGDLEDRHLLARRRGCTCGRPRAGASARDDAVGEVLDVDERRDWLPSPATVSGSPASALLDERGDHRGGRARAARTGSRSAGSCTRARTARRRSGSTAPRPASWRCRGAREGAAACPRRRRSAGDVGVHPDRRGVDHALHAGRAARPRARASVPRALRRSASSGSASTSLTSAGGGQMDDGVAARHRRRAARSTSRQVAHDGLDVAAVVDAERPQVEDPRDVPAASSASTTWEPMKPAPPVTSTRSS